MRLSNLVSDSSGTAHETQRENGTTEQEPLEETIGLLLGCYTTFVGIATVVTSERNLYATSTMTMTSTMPQVRYSTTCKTCTNFNVRSSINSSRDNSVL